MSGYEIFVSHSFHERDRELVRHVKDFCRCAGYEPMDLKQPTYRLPREKVKAAIGKSRVFLGLLTIDHDDPNSRSTGDWLISEIGMAEYADLPILLFIEQGVAFKPADHITCHQPFVRDDPVDLWKDLVRVLVELRSDSRIVWGADAIEGEPYALKMDDVEIDIDDVGIMRVTRHVELESKIAKLDAIRPQTKIITSSKKLGYHESELTFYASSNDHPMQFEVIKNEPQEVAYRVLFIPPLRETDTATFTVGHASRGSLPLVLEDLQELLRVDYITDALVARQGYAIKEPTQHLMLQMKFPDGYAIASFNPRLEVTLRQRVGDSKDSAAELERVKPHFRVRHNRLCLEVEYPKRDHSYYFVWTPPRGKELPDHLHVGLAGAGAE